MLFQKMCVRRVCSCLSPIVFAIFVVIVCVAINFNKDNAFMSGLVSFFRESLSTMAGSRKLYCWLRLACLLQLT